MAGEGGGDDRRRRGGGKKENELKQSDLKEDATNREKWRNAVKIATGLRCIRPLSMTGENRIQTGHGWMEVKIKK